MTNRWLGRFSLAATLAALAGGCGSDSSVCVLPDAAPPKAAPLDAAVVDGNPSEVYLQENLLIDDFEDGNGQAAYRGGVWYSYDDTSNGAASSIAYTGATGSNVAMNGPGFESTRSLEVSFTFDKGTYKYDPYVGWGVRLAGASTPLDVSKYLGVGYTYRGSAHRVRIETFEVADYDYFGMEVPASADWKTVAIPFKHLTQEGWGIKVAFNSKNIGTVSFQAKGRTGTQGKANIDNLVLLASLPPQVPDMVVLPPLSPPEDPIASIAVTHPGQAKAHTYLTRGYNITNWLEQDRFSGFTYDEAYVTKLAAAGFKSLRLPVDLDRYIIGGTTSGEAGDAGSPADAGDAVDAGGTLDVVVHNDLFKVLDAFVEWTAKAGMSLTIDFHQYDKSLDKSKPETIARAIAVWGKVAARYASNPREDLFYELLNEPEQSMDGTPPTQSEWTAIAERMIAAIRASDTKHTILFGDVNYYGIGPLSVRKPFSDGNIIYVFHFYEPFLFTHQGASWAGMSSTHDLPYPYRADRWSAYFGDLGFNQAMEPWILVSARNYYWTGTRSSIRNQIVQAKLWAVANNVPVICNEFGAYAGTSRMEDRARYLTDLVSIFDELDIPWQQWFMIMDSAGKVAPEYRAALKLGQ